MSSVICQEKNKKIPLLFKTEGYDVVDEVSIKINDFILLNDTEVTVKPGFENHACISAVVII